MGMVSISDTYMTLLQEYSKMTGVSVNRCVFDALFDWLGNVAPVTLEQMGLPPLKSPYAFRPPNTANRGTLRR
jgi:hypothetical protein